MRADQLRQFVTQLTPDELVYLLYSHELRTRKMMLAQALKGQKSIF